MAGIRRDNVNKFKFYYMSINLLEAVQQKLGYPVLQKIDPNTQEVKADKSTPDEERFSQAAIPSVLIALYNYSTLDAGAEAILNGGEYDWTENIFGDHKEEAIKKIAEYSYQSPDQAYSQIEEIADEAIVEIKNNLKPEAHIIDVKKLLADQRNLVLPYLPADLHMGEILNNPTFDDRTNKMEGPVSNLMHAIGNIFSASDTEEKKEPKF